MINKQQGSTTLIFTMLISCLGLFIIFWGNYKMHIYNRHKTLNNMTLCSLEYKDKTNKLINNIDKINTIIKIGKKASLISYFINLPFSFLKKLSIEKLISMLKHTQQMIFFNYIKEITHIKNQKCDFSISFFKTPFKHKYFKLMRKNHQVVINKNFKAMLRGQYYQFNFQINKKRKIHVKFLKKTKWYSPFRYFTPDASHNLYYLSNHIN